MHLLVRAKDDAIRREVRPDSKVTVGKITGLLGLFGLTCPPRAVDPSSRPEPVDLPHPPPAPPHPPPLRPRRKAVDLLRAAGLVSPQDQTEATPPFERPNTIPAHKLLFYSTEVYPPPPPGKL